MTATSSEAHTPLPWIYRHGRIYANDGRRERADAVADICIAFKASKERDANAALIVTAVNERPKLRERLRKMEEALRKARVAIATWSPDPTEPLEEIDAALKAE